MRYALIYIIASQLVSLQDVFHLAVQFSKYKSGFRSFGLLSLPSALRSLKTIQVQEEEQSFARSIDRNFLPCWLLFVFAHLLCAQQTFVCIDLVSSLTISGLLAP